MKQNLFSHSCALLLASGLVTTATASDWSLGGNLALASDYVSRGFTQTDAGSALQGGLDLTHASGFLAGVWGSNVEGDPDAAFNFDGASQELDITLGWSGKLGDSGLEATVKAARYLYPGTRFDPYNTNEYSLHLAYDFGPAKVKGGVYYSDDYSGQGAASYWDTEVSVPIGPATLVLHYGGQWYENPAVDDYEDYKAGLAGEVAGLGLDLSYYGTSGVAAGCTSHTCGERFVFTLSKAFY